MVYDNIETTASHRQLACHHGLVLERWTGTAKTCCVYLRYLIGNHQCNGQRRTRRSNSTSDTQRSGCLRFRHALCSHTSEEPQRQQDVLLVDIYHHADFGMTILSCLNVFTLSKPSSHVPTIASSIGKNERRSRTVFRV